MKKKKKKETLHKKIEKINVRLERQFKLKKTNCFSDKVFSKQKFGSKYRRAKRILVASNGSARFRAKWTLERCPLGPFVYKNFSFFLFFLITREYSKKGMLTVSFCDRNTGTGNRSRSRSTRGSCTRTQIDVTAAHTAGALLTHGAVRSWWAVRCHLPAADAYAYPPKVNISWFTYFMHCVRRALNIKQTNAVKCTAASRCRGISERTELLFFLLFLFSFVRLSRQIAPMHNADEYLYISTNKSYFLFPFSIPFYSYQSFRWFVYIRIDLNILRGTSSEIK